MLYLIELRGPFLQTLPLSRAPKVSPEEEAEPRAKEALTEYLVKLRPETRIIVERIVTDIDEIVKKVRFPD